MHKWQRHFVHTKTSTTTTWKLRLATVAALIVVAILTSPFWTVQIARSLVCAERVGTSDAILVENFDPEYVLFERAASMVKAGVAPTVLVPVQTWSGADVGNPVSTDVAEVMARHAKLTAWRTIPIRQVEPISLNAAFQIRAYLTRAGITSVIVVTPGFRSRRSFLVYRATLRDVGMKVYCVPVFSHTTPESWANTWHGIEDVAQEFVKLQYYRFYVLPFLVRRGEVK